MRFLAVDLGDRRTGLAVGDAFTRLVSPVDVLEVPLARNRGNDLLAALARAVEEHLSLNDAIVLGLPLNMDGSEGPRAKLVRAFASRLHDFTRRTIHFQDERLSSADADWSMARSGLTHARKKARRDALAAAAILRDFLEALPPTTP